MKFSPDVLALNPALRDATTRRQASGREDVADELLAVLKRDAPALVNGCERDRRFGTFRIDLAWPGAMLACEVNGGLRRPGGGKHATSRDHQKVRALVLAGWRVLIFTSSEVRHDPAGCIEDIRKGLGL